MERDEFLEQARKAEAPVYFWLRARGWGEDAANELIQAALDHLHGHWQDWTADHTPQAALAAVVRKVTDTNRFLAVERIHRIKAAIAEDRRPRAGRWWRGAHRRRTKFRSAKRVQGWLSDRREQVRALAIARVDGKELTRRPVAAASPVTLEAEHPE